MSFRHKWGPPLSCLKKYAHISDRNVRNGGYWWRTMHTTCPLVKKNQYSFNLSQTPCPWRCGRSRWNSRDSKLKLTKKNIRFDGNRPLLYQCHCQTGRTGRCRRPSTSQLPKPSFRSIYDRKRHNSRPNIGWNIKCSGYRNCYRRRNRNSGCYLHYSSQWPLNSFLWHSKKWHRKCRTGTPRRGRKRKRHRPQWTQ